MAPLPKPEGARRHPGKNQWRTLTRGAVPVPAMPGSSKLEPAVKRAAQQYWRTIWTDLGEMFTDADRFPLARLCVLDARVRVADRPPGAQLQAELRQLEQAYGVSALGRQRLMIHVQDTDGDAPGHSADVASMDEHRRRQRERRKRILASQ